MLELLRKLGIPPMLALLVACLVSVVPVSIELDNRYSKAEETQKNLDRVNWQLRQLASEVSSLAGTEPVLVAVVTANNNKPTVLLPPVANSTVPLLEKKKALESANTSLQATQQRLQVLQTNMGKQNDHSLP